MLKIIIRKIFTSFCIFFFFSLNSYSSENYIKELEEGEKIIFIRHALAPGSGDPPKFKIKDCKTQRNLSQTGIDQSKRIGKFFKVKNISIDKVLSSQWCRCKDTARYAFGMYKEFSPLNSTFQSKFSKNEPRQLKELNKYISKWNGKGKNLVLVTHYSIITAITDAVPSSGEIVITDKQFNVLATILID